MPKDFFKQQYQGFSQALQEYGALQPLVDQLPSQLEQGLNLQRYGDIPKWLECVAKLPTYNAQTIVLNHDTVSISGDELTAEQKQQFSEQLKMLMPWRKGPFNLFDIHIDTEWRSDWKWNRLRGAIEPLAGKRVLDVGCGSGYHCWRMRGEAADLVVGIEPSPLFIMQFLTLQHYIQDHHVGVLPMTMEQLPNKLEAFHSVFSMGVLYHRRSPIDHLQELKDALIKGGQLILETLIVDGDEGYSLIPEGRYARMGNVWFIPSVKTLITWLKKLKFNHIQVIDENVTSIEEQRATEWMGYQSLADFLDPNDHSKTIEGYPAPKRVVITAIKTH